MFGEEYKIFGKFPEHILDYQEVLDLMIRWTDRLQSSSGDWTGNLFDFFFHVYGKSVKDLKIPFKLDGITRIYSVWAQQGWKQPEVIEEYGPDRTILRLSFVKKVAIKNGDKKVLIKSGDKKKMTKKTEQQLKLILEYMAPDQEYKTSELAEIIGVKESRTRILINELVKSGRIKATGKNKGRSYRLK